MTSKFVIADPSLKDHRGTKRFNERFGSYPVLRVHDLEGNDIGGRIDGNRVAGKIPAEKVVEQLKSSLEKFGGASAGWESSMEKGLEAARKDDRPVLVLLTDGDKEDLKEILDPLGSDECRELVGKFVLVRHNIEEKCGICDEHKVRKGTVLHAVDPNEEKPGRKPLAKASGKKSDKAMRAFLESALKKWDRAKRDY